MEEFILCDECGEKYLEGTLCNCVRERMLEKIRITDKEYILAENINVKREDGIHPLVSEILAKRGIMENQRVFIEAGLDSLVQEKMLGQEEAARKILEFLDRGDRITIYGDYDVDGVTSTALGLNILRALGANVDYYINDRFQEGFGIQKSGVEKISQRGTKLIITVDNGISGAEAVEYAKSLGMEVIVTDHHDPNGPLPQCLVVDPKQPGCSYPHRNLVGAAVFFKVLKSLCELKGVPRLPLKELDLVALGTVADVAPLIGENRILVKNGLKLINWEKCRIGFKALKDVAKIDEVSSYHLGFIFGPMINAEGRLVGSPDTSVTLLTTDNYKEALDCAEELSKANQKRRNMLDEQYQLAENLVDPTKKMIFLVDSRFHEGIVGLIAGKLKEGFYRPAIVLGRDEAGRYKGSGRSIEEINMKSCLDKLSFLLEAYGGHSMACGLTIKEENISTVKNMLETETNRQMRAGDFRPKVYIDAVLDLKDLDFNLINSLKELEPFGQGFSRPRLAIKGIRPERLDYLKEKHTKISSGGIDILFFNRCLEGEGPFDLVGYPDINKYAGKINLQFKAEGCLNTEI